MTPKLERHERGLSAVLLTLKREGIPVKRAPMFWCKHDAKIGGLRLEFKTATVREPYGIPVWRFQVGRHNQPFNASEADFVWLHCEGYEDFILPGAAVHGKHTIEVYREYTKHKNPLVLRSSISMEKFLGEIKCEAKMA